MGGRRVFVAIVAAVVFGTGLVGPASAATEVEMAFRCQSPVGSSPTTYWVTGDVPSTVEPGGVITLRNVVVKGVAPGPVVITDIKFLFYALSTTPGDFAKRFISDPPEPPMVTGEYGYTPPMSFRLTAPTEEGIEIRYYLVAVFSMVANPQTLANALPVACVYQSGGSFGSTVVATTPV